MTLLRGKWENLGVILQREKRLLVAFSGGCDSAFLLHAALFFLGKKNVTAITAVSPSLSEQEKTEVLAIVEEWNVDHQFVETAEMQNAQYVANPVNRCFYCKDELFKNLVPIASQRHQTVADGLNFSDRLEFRPGVKAAQKWNVIHPLEEAGLLKKDIRILSRWRGVKTWKKPAAPCLASRIPHGTHVTSEALRSIERAEAVLRAEGFLVMRVRYFGEEAKIEVEKNRIPELSQADRWQKVVAQIKLCGFRKVSIDPDGFRSGKLQERHLFASVADNSFKIS